MYQDLLERIKSDGNFFKRVKTGDESWVFKYDHKTKRRSAKWHTKIDRSRRKQE